MLDLSKRVRGMFVKLPTTDVVDLVVDAGFDFLVVDLEHSQLADAEAFRLLRHAFTRGFPALARIPAVDRGLVNRLLEAGAVGIHASTVRRAAEIRELRDAVRYAPGGTRSISLAHPAGRYGALELADYLAEQRVRVPLVVAQIETGETDDALDEVASAGADVLFVGTTDLAVDLALDEERTRRRIDEVAAAAERAGIPLGVFGVDEPRAGYIAVSTDIALLRKAIADAA
jgi:4-hydroxy-2-oxoheptanedioate aldolase